MHQYDAGKYRAIGVGETLRGSHLYWDGINGIAVPIHAHLVGHVLDGQEEFTYLEALPSPAVTTIDRLAEESGIVTDIGLKALRLAVENIKLLDSKQRDYGSGNIAAFGEFGVLVRTWDKISRLRNLLTNVQDPKNESITDSWVDLGNYAIIAQICRKGEWK